MLYVSQKLQLPYTINTRYTFWVTGKGTFPFDMLRFDQCWPIDRVEDVSKKESRSIKMMSLSGEPTVYRWHTFGWAVTKEAPIEK